MSKYRGIDGVVSDFMMISTQKNAGYRNECFSSLLFPPERDQVNRSSTKRKNFF